jgi:hypothetical protein
MSGRAAGILVIAGIVAACGGGSGGGGAATSGATAGAAATDAAEATAEPEAGTGAEGASEEATPAAAVSIKDGCSLVTLDELKAITGKDVQTTPSFTGGQFTWDSGYCNWQSTDGQFTVNLDLEYGISGTENLRSTAKDQLAEEKGSFSGQSGYEELSAVGDAAMYVPGLLMAVKGDVILTLSTNPEKMDKAGMIAVAKAALARV